MPQELASLVVNVTRDGTWAWRMYDDSGRVMGEQDKCPDFGTAVITAMEWINPPTPLADLPARPKPHQVAKSRRKSRSA